MYIYIYLYIYIYIYYCRMPQHEAYNLAGAIGTLHLSMIYIYIFIYIYLYICPDLQEITDSGNYND